MQQLQKISILFMIYFCGLFGSAAVMAEDGGAAAGGSEWSGHVGTFLPNQIEGVTEILPMFGLRYGIPLAGGVVESGFQNAHAKGVDYTSGVFSFRGDFPMNDLVPFGYGGVDLNYYRPIREDSRRTITGFHVGTGVMLHVASSLWLRSELKFSIGPGTALYLGFGLALRSTGSGN